MSVALGLCTTISLSPPTLSLTVPHAFSSGLCLCACAAPEMADPVFAALYGKYQKKKVADLKVVLKNNRTVMTGTKVRFPCPT